MKNLLIFKLVLLITIECFSQTSIDYVKQGILNNSKSEYDDALLNFNKAIHLDSLNDLAFFHRGKTYWYLGNGTGSTRDFTIAISLNPNENSYYDERATNRRNMGDYQGALDDYSEIIKIDSKNYSSYIERGVMKMRLNDVNGAIADYSKAIDIAPLHVISYAYRAGAKEELKDYIGAVQDYTEAIDIEPLYYPLNYLYRGQVKNELKDYRGAIRDFDIFLETSKGNGSSTWNEVFFNRGYANHSLRKNDKAIDDYTKALIHDSKDKGSYYNRGLCKIDLGDKEGGCLDLSKAGELGYEPAYKAITNFCND